MSVRRPCLGPGNGQQCPHGYNMPKKIPRCIDCKRAVQRAKDARRPGRKDVDEVMRRRHAVELHVQQYGYTCPGDTTPGFEVHAPHPSMDLTADHLVPVVVGGSEHGPLRVLCRARNSQLGARLSGRRDLH